jgi:hypothetical protein
MESVPSKASTPTPPLRAEGLWPPCGQERQNTWTGRGTCSATTSKNVSQSYSIDVLTGFPKPRAEVRFLPGAQLKPQFRGLLGTIERRSGRPWPRIGPAADMESSSRSSILLSLSCRPRPLAPHTTVQTVMASHAGEQMLARSRRGRTDFCRAETHTRLRKFVR